MSEISNASLYRTGFLVFEELGFMLPTAELDEEQRSASADAAVRVRFSGNLSGVLILAVSVELLPVLAANMLGEAETPSEDNQQDALGELANVICGNLLPQLAGPEALFQIGSPEFLANLAECERWPSDPTAVSHIGLDQGRADLYLYLEQAASQKVPIRSAP